MKLRFTCILLSALLLFSGLAMAQVQPDNPEIREFLSKGGKIIYIGKNKDLDVWILLKKNGAPIAKLSVSPSGAIIREKMELPKRYIWPASGVADSGVEQKNVAPPSPYNFIRSHDRWMQIGAVGLVIFLRVFFGFRRRSLAGMMLGGLLGGSRRRW